MYSVETKGFTIIELLIVVLLVSVLLIMGVPAMQRSLALSRLESTAQQILTELNVARTLSVSRNTTYQFTLENSSGSFRITDPNSDQHPRLARKLEQGVQAYVSGSQPIEFYSRGYARGGVVTLSTELGLTIVITVSNSGTVTRGQTLGSG